MQKTSRYERHQWACIEIVVDNKARTRCPALKSHLKRQKFLPAAYLLHIGVQLIYVRFFCLKTMMWIGIQIQYSVSHYGSVGDLCLVLHGCGANTSVIYQETCLPALLCRFHIITVQTSLKFYIFLLRLSEHAVISDSDSFLDYWPLFYMQGSFFTKATRQFS